MITGDSRADALAHEAWSAAQLAPGEGIEDGVRRIKAILSRSSAMATEPFAWIHANVPEHFASPIAYSASTELLKNQKDGYLPIYLDSQPAQADARVGLADEQREAVEHVVFEFLRELVADDYWSESKANRAREIIARAAGRTCCPHGIHWDNACGACIPPRGTRAVSFTRSAFRNGSRWTTFNVRTEDADEAEHRLRGASANEPEKKS